ncbi:MAG: SulP family inorganic anion transporter [Bacteroidales bacterium]|nr:SulP family inorganic anion transporter [Bacteroidales bacterium]
MFQADLLSGIIVGIVALPLAIAFAVASGVNPAQGLITAIVAGFIISFLGGSRVQIGGPTGAFIVVVYGIVEQYQLSGLMIATIMAGVLLVLFGLLKLGSVIKYIPHPLVVGFTSGIALTIFSTQVKDAFGLETGKLPGDFIGKWSMMIDAFGTINPWAVGITVVTILISVYFVKVTPKIPGSFVAIVVVTLVTYIFDIPVATIGKTVSGETAMEIPTTISFSFPEIDFSQVKDLIGPAITIAVLGAIESLLSAVVADGMIGANHKSNTELIAQGIANIAAPIFGGIPATGAIARTATNVKNGGRTPIAGMIHAVVLLLIMFFAAKLAESIPLACLAGVLIVVSYNMSEWRSFLSITKGSKYDTVILLVTFFLTVLVDLTAAIEVGMVLAAFIFMKRMSDQSEVIDVKKESDTVENYAYLPKGIEIYEISGPFFFGAAKKYRETLRQFGNEAKVLVIRMRHVPFMDATGARNFEAMLSDMEDLNVKVVLSGVNESVYSELNKTGIVEKLGNKNVCSNFDLAQQRAKEVLQEVNPGALA